MLTLSEDALALIAERKQPVLIDMPQSIEGCCLEITPCPSVRFGTPRNRSGYTLREIRNTQVFVPDSLPNTRPLTIRTRNLLGLRLLVLDGWRIV